MPGKKLTQQQLTAIQPYKENILSSLYEVLGNYYVLFDDPKRLTELIQEGEIRKPDGSKYDKDATLDEFIYELWDRDNQLRSREEYMELQWESQIEINVEASKEEHYLTVDQINNLRDAMQSIYQPFAESKEYDDFHIIADRIFDKAQRELHKDPNTTMFFISDRDFNELKKTDKQLLDMAKKRSFLVEQSHMYADKDFNEVQVSFADDVPAGEMVKITSTGVHLNTFNVELTESMQTAVSDLLEDLKATDSAFSRDSKEYKNLKSALTQLSEKLKNTPVSSGKDLKEVFAAKFRTDSKDTKERSVLSCVNAYLNAKQAKTGDLSDRQIDRMSICQRFKSISTKLSQTAENKVPDISKDIALNTIAHKAFLKEARKLDADELNEIFKGQKLYNDELGAYSQAHSQRIQTLRGSEAPTLLDMSRQTPDKIQSLGAIPDARDIEMLKFLQDRTAVLTEKINSINGSKAPGYKEFKKALVELNDNLKNIEGDLSLENMHNALEHVSDIADYYKRQAFRMNEKKERANTAEFDKLEIASEINMLSAYSKNSDLTLKGFLSTMHVYHLIKEEYHDQPNNQNEYERLISNSNNLAQKIQKRCLSDTVLKINLKNTKTSALRDLVVNEGKPKEIEGPELPGMH